MWCRKRIDVAWSDLAFGLLSAVFRRDRGSHQQAVARAWPTEDRNPWACLSVRSGWDLLLGAIDLPKGSEVLMSALTIPDVVRIVEAHGLVPVPLDLDVQTAAPTPEELERAITPRSKVVLIAHLFGTRVDLRPLINVAHAHQLLFVEDCAQAYAGPAFAGHPEADVSAFSFGTIKTNTALGGGVFHVRDADLLASIQDRQAAYPVQARGKYFRRLLKYGGLKALSTYPLYGLFVRFCRLVGIDHNELLNRSVRGFAGTGVERFRLRPGAPLLALLARRLRHYSSARLTRQQALGTRLLERLPPGMVSPGSAAGYHHFWVFPVLTDEPHELIHVLDRAGFDATQGQSLCVVEPPADRPDLEPPHARDLLARMVYVPAYAELSDRAVDQLAEVLVRFQDEKNTLGLPRSTMTLAKQAAGKEQER